MKTIGYLRVSHLESLNGSSFETQEKKIRQYASLHDFEITDVFSEVIGGGTEFRKRKIFSKFFSELSRGDSIVVARLDRLSRTILHTLQFVELCQQKKIGLHIVDLGEVTDNGLGRIFLNILSCLAETERLRISERIKTQKSFAKKERKYLGGSVEFGYKKGSDGKLIPDEKEFAIIESAFNLRHQGLKYREIADEIKRKHGRKIFFQQIHRILNREHNKKVLQVAV